jgi:acyl carrier protein
MKVITQNIVELILQAGTQANESLINGDADLRGAGCDSLDMMNIVLIVQEKYNIEISDNELDSIQTVNDIVDILNK